MALADDILEIKSRCRIAEEIGTDYGLGEREVVCVSAIGSRGAVHSKSLSDIIGLSPSRGSRIINRLVDRGFLESTPDPEDRRYLNLRLSPRGVECLECIESKKRECEKRMLDGLTPEQRRTVRDGIALLLEVI